MDEFDAFNITLDAERIIKNVMEGSGEDEAGEVAVALMMLDTMNLMYGFVEKHPELENDNDLKEITLNIAALYNTVEKEFKDKALELYRNLSDLSKDVKQKYGE